MAQVNAPQQKKDFTQQILTLGGAAAGAYFSGGQPSGAMMGAQAGQMAGGLVPQKEGPQTVDSSSAVQRRMQGMQQMPSVPDQQATLNNARVALQAQPIEVQKEYAPMLMAASAQLRRQQGAV